MEFNLEDSFVFSFKTWQINKIATKQVSEQDKIVFNLFDSTLLLKYKNTRKLFSYLSEICSGNFPFFDTIVLTEYLQVADLFHDYGRLSQIKHPENKPEVTKYVAHANVFFNSPYNFDRLQTLHLLDYNNLFLSSKLQYKLQLIYNTNVVSDRITKYIIASFLYIWMNLDFVVNDFHRFRSYQKYSKSDSFSVNKPKLNKVRSYFYQRFKTYKLKNIDDYKLWYLVDAFLLAVQDTVDIVLFLYENKDKCSVSKHNFIMEGARLGSNINFTNGIYTRHDTLSMNIMEQKLDIELPVQIMYCISEANKVNVYFDRRDSFDCNRDTFDKVISWTFSFEKRPLEQSTSYMIINSIVTNDNRFAISEKKEMKIYSAVTSKSIQLPKYRASSISDGDRLSTMHWEVGTRLHLPKYAFNHAMVSHYYWNNEFSHWKSKLNTYNLNTGFAQQLPHQLTKIESSDGFVDLYGEWIEIEYPEVENFSQLHFYSLGTPEIIVVCASNDGINFREICKSTDHIFYTYLEYTLFCHFEWSDLDTKYKYWRIIFPKADTRNFYFSYVYRISRSTYQYGTYVDAVFIQFNKQIEPNPENIYYRIYDTSSSDFIGFKFVYNNSRPYRYRYTNFGLTESKYKLEQWLSKIRKEVDVEIENGTIQKTISSYPKSIVLS